MELKSDVRPSTRPQEIVVPPDDLGDSAKRFAQVRAEVTGLDGTSYRAFRGSLKPNYRRVWVQLCAGYVALLVLVGIMLAVEMESSWIAAVIALPVAVSLGFVIHFLSLFQHAAAHYNLSSELDRNDRLSNQFLGILLGSHIKAYRAVHMQHHKWHGTPNDPENAYVRRPDWRFFARWASGIGTIEKLLANSSTIEDVGASRSYRWFKLLSLACHVTVFAIAAYHHYFAFAVAWTLAVGVFFPMFSDLRVVLEHRSSEADPMMDYRKTPHGAFTRLFRGGFFTHTFGGAGFEHHLLHHFDPSVPFERLPDLDRFLRGAGLAEFLEQRTTTYGKALQDVLRH